MAIQACFEWATGLAQFIYNFMMVSPLSRYYAQFTVWWFLAHHQASLGTIHFSKYNNQNGQVESKLETKQGSINDVIS